MLVSLLFLSFSFTEITALGNEEVAVGPFGWGDDGGYKCELYHNADGVGEVFELNRGDCIRKFEKTGDSFIYHSDFYRNRDHCQKTVFTNKRYDHGWEICSPKGTVEINFDWDDQKGWCVGEDHRKGLGGVSSRAACLTKCEREMWNGKYPRGCEYSRNYGTCNVFFGTGMWSTNKGSSYRCNVNVKEGVKMTEEEVGCGRGMIPDLVNGGCMHAEASVADPCYYTGDCETQTSLAFSNTKDHVGPSTIVQAFALAGFLFTLYGAACHFLKN